MCYSITTLEKYTRNNMSTNFMILQTPPVMSFSASKFICSSMLPKVSFGLLNGEAQCKIWMLFGFNSSKRLAAVNVFSAYP